VPGALARLLAPPLVALVSYLVVGSAMRLAFPAEIAAGDLRAVVRLSAAAAFALTAWTIWKWRAAARALGGFRLHGAPLAGLLTITIGWDVYRFTTWASHHTEHNYSASVEVGRLLAPGTLVHGKLANGLSLENAIRPVFVGRGFGNYDDRLERDDVRYMLTYVAPSLGYESQSGLVAEILDRYPRSRVVRTFDVDETPGEDKAALIDKFGDR
jgi:hypothetical protein